MKKVISLILALAMVLSLVACGSSNNRGDNSGNAANSTVTDTDGDTNSNTAGSGEDEKEETDPQEPAQEEEEEQQEETPVITITASHSDVTMKAAGNSFQLTADGVSDSAKVTYTSEDETVATAAEDGTVTAVAPGTTNILMHVEQDGAAYDFTCIVRCSWQEGGSAASGVDLNAYFNSFMAGLGADNTPAMAELNADLIDAYYTGLNEISRKQSVLQMAAMMQVAFEFALVECENAADVETVKSIFQSRVDSQVNGGAWYPAVAAAWENADIIVNGNIVALIVAGEQQSAAVAAFKDACSGK